jgi:site-specific DNA-methyltransferase (adenine-specific)
MPLLLLGDCLEEMKTIDDDSVDFIFCDLPYGHTSCKWDCKIDLDKFWIEIMRIKKLRTPIFMTTTTKFGVELINSAPKNCPFRYDLVWVKSHSTSFLHAKHRPMTKHELVYVFYERLPFYDLSSHKHKLSQYIGVKEDKQTNNYKAKRIIYKDENGNVIKEGQSGKNHTKYNPPLPTSILEVKSVKGKHSTEKPVALIEWLLKYFSKEGDVVLDPTMGSGSTGVACKNLNRKFIGIELDDDIFEVATTRLGL